MTRHRPLGDAAPDPRASASGGDGNSISPLRSRDLRSSITCAGTFAGSRPPLVTNLTTPGAHLAACHCNSIQTKVIFRRHRGRSLDQRKHRFDFASVLSVLMTERLLFDHTSPGANRSLNITRGPA
jgi:hypothetical protein